MVTISNINALSIPHRCKNDGRVEVKARAIISYHDLVYTTRLDTAQMSHQFKIKPAEKRGLVRDVH